MTYKTDKRLYLTEDKQVTDDPEQGYWLLVAEGDELSDADAERYGLTGSGKGSKAVSAPPENKAVSPPDADAGKVSAESKG